MVVVVVGIPGEGADRRERGVWGREYDGAVGELTL